MKQANQIVVENIRAKDRKRGGKLIEGKAEMGQNALIVPGKTISLFGRHQGELYERNFKIGDLAEYDSYNLSYLGTIVAITEKTVTIKEEYSDTIHRLDLYTFNWRNRRFDLEQTRRSNAETSMCI